MTLPNLTYPVRDDEPMPGASCKHPSVVWAILAVTYPRGRRHRPGIIPLIDCRGRREPMLTQEEGTALSEFILMVGEHRGRMVKGHKVEVSPEMIGELIGNA